MPELKLFAGNAIPELAQKIATRLGAKLGDATVGRFSDGEVQVQINENVRGSDVFIIQSTCAPTNDNLMELVVMIDAMRRASAGRITAVVPYCAVHLPVVSQRWFLTLVMRDRIAAYVLHVYRLLPRL